MRSAGPSRSYTWRFLMFGHGRRAFVGDTGSRWSCRATSGISPDDHRACRHYLGVEIEQLVRRPRVTSRVVCVLGVRSRRLTDRPAAGSALTASGAPAVLVRGLRKTARGGTGDRPRNHADRSRGRVFSRHTVTRSRKSRHQNRADKLTMSDFKGVGGALLPARVGCWKHPLSFTQFAIHGRTKAAARSSLFLRRGLRRTWQFYDIF